MMHGPTNTRFSFVLCSSSRSVVSAFSWTKSTALLKYWSCFRGMGCVLKGLSIILDMSLVQKHKLFCRGFYFLNYNQKDATILFLLLLLLLLPFALQPAVGFVLSNNVFPFFPICHHLSPSSHAQHLKISFYFIFPPFPVSSPSSRPFQFLSEDIFGHPTILHSL